MAQATTPQGPDKDTRQDISRQLQFLASVLGENINLNATESVGLMNLLYQLADRVFPEGIE